MHLQKCLTFGVHIIRQKRAFYLLRIGNATGYVNAAGGCVGQGMGNAASVSDHVQPRMAGLKIFVDGNFHVVEFDLNAVQKRIVVGGSGSNPHEECKQNSFD